MKYLAVILAALLLSTSALAQATAVTEFANTGFEANNFNNGTISVAYTTKRALTITGWNIFLSMAPSPGSNLPSMWGTAQLAEVLFYITLDGLRPGSDDFNVGVAKDWQGNKHGLHGGNAVHNRGQIAQAILKTLVSSGVPGSVNQPLVQSGLSVPLPEGAVITFWAGHEGWGPMDFEVQGGLTYE